MDEERRQHIKEILDESLNKVNEGNYDDVVAQKTFNDLQEIFHDTEEMTELLAMYMLCGWGEDYSKVYKATPFRIIKPVLTLAIKKQLDNQRSWNAINLLSSYGEDSFELLEYLLHNGTYDDVIEIASSGLANLGKIEMLEETLQSENRIERFRYSIIYGSIWKLYNLPLSANDELFVELFIKHLADPEPEIRRCCLYHLAKSHMLPIREIDNILDGDNSNEKHLLLQRLLELDFKHKDREESIRQFPNIDAELSRVLVKALEDETSRISKSFLSLMKGLLTFRYLYDEDIRQKIDIFAFVDAIIDQLIIRSSGRLPNYFSNENIVEALRLAIKFLPRIENHILERLCEIAFSSESSIRRQAVFVGLGINELVFRARVIEHEEMDPKTTLTILNMAGQTIGEYIMGNKNVFSGDFNDSQIFIGNNFTNAFNNLVGQDQGKLANELRNLIEAIRKSDTLGATEQKEYIDIVTEIAEEKAKPNPNKIKIQSLWQRLSELIKLTPALIKLGEILSEWL